MTWQARALRCEAALRQSNWPTLAVVFGAGMITGALAMMVLQTFLWG